MGHPKSYGNFLYLNGTLTAVPKLFISLTFHIQLFENTCTDCVNTPMPLSSKLDRMLRAAEESSDDDEYYEVTDGSSPSIIDTGAEIELRSSEEAGDDNLSEGEGMVSRILKT